MLKKSVLVLSMVLLAGGAGQLRASLILDDGESHTISTAIDGNVEIYDGSTPPLPDITTVNLVDGGSVGNHLAVGEHSEVFMWGGSVGQSVHTLDSAKVEVVGGRIDENIFVRSNGQVTLRGGSLGEFLVGEDNGALTIRGWGFAIDGAPVGFGSILSVLGGNYWDEPMRRLSGMLESGESLDNDFQLGHQGLIFLEEGEEIPEPASILIATVGGSLLARRRGLLR